MCRRAAHSQHASLRALEQDKDAKVNYLQKMIDVVGLVLNQHVPAKPLKVRSRSTAG